MHFIVGYPQKMCMELDCISKDTPETQGLSGYGEGGF